MSFRSTCKKLFKKNNITSKQSHLKKLLSIKKEVGGLHFESDPLYKGLTNCLGNDIKYPSVSKHTHSYTTKSLLSHSSSQTVEQVEKLVRSGLEEVSNKLTVLLQSIKNTIPTSSIFTKLVNFIKKNISKKDKKKIEEIKKIVVEMKAMKKGIETMLKTMKENKESVFMFLSKPDSDEKKIENLQRIQTIIDNYKEEEIPILSKEIKELISSYNSIVSKVKSSSTRRKQGTYG